MKHDDLPRQARDKQKETSRENGVSQELRPLGTYYGGAIDAPLTDSEFGKALDNGYIGVVTNTPNSFEPKDRAHFLNSTCRYIQRSLTNQRRLYDSYGNALGRCKTPASRPALCKKHQPSRTVPVKLDDGFAAAAVAMTRRDD